MTIGAAYDEEVKKIVIHLDEILDEFKLPTFYEVFEIKFRFLMNHNSVQF